MTDLAQDLRTRKRALRVAAELKRQELFQQSPAAGEKVAEFLLQTIRPRDPDVWAEGTIISTYAERGSEMAMTQVNLALVAAGYQLALPVVLGRGHPLAFRRYRPHDPLIKGVLDVGEPLPSEPIVVPRILLLPLLGFDRQGNRLGYGGGYYDRTMVLLRREVAVQGIGIAFAGQEYPEIPVGTTDAPLDWIVTEREALHCSASG
jgi:5-formyltetrahydrofolate cyclo-ligase